MNVGVQGYGGSAETQNMAQNITSAGTIYQTLRNAVTVTIFKRQLQTHIFMLEYYP